MNEIKVKCPHCGVLWPTYCDVGKRLIQCSAETGSCGNWFVVEVKTTIEVEVWKLVEAKNDEI